MLDTIRTRAGGRRGAPVFTPRGDTLALAVCFAFGAGAALLLRSAFRTEAPESVFAAGYAQALWSCCRFPLVLLFLAGSVWGSALVPAVTAVRAYMLSSAAMTVAASFPGGAALSLLAVGVPALVTVPCFFVLAADCAASSRRLAAAGSGRASPGPPAPLLRHTLVCVPVLAGAAALEAFVIPILGAPLLK